MSVILDNSNIVESYPGITLPLTTSFIEHAYFRVCSGAVRRLIADDAVMTTLEPRLRKMVVSYEGRIYYTLNSWYAILSLFPLQGRIKKVWRHMLGVSPTTEIASPVTLTVLQQLKVANNIRRSTRHLPQDMQRLDHDFKTIYQSFYKRDLAGLTNQELIDLYYEIESSFVSRWEVTLANDMYAFIYTWLAEKYTPHARRLLSGISNVESMKPVRALLSLAEFAAASHAIPALQKLQTPAQVERWLSSRGPVARQAREFIMEYGDRYVEELKLESETYRSSPQLLIKQILTYAKTPPTLPSDQPPDNRPLALGLGRVFLDRAIVGIKNREISRLNRSRLYGMVRTIITHIADNLCAEGALKHADDIHYLTLDEVFSLDRDMFHKVIRTRKKQYESYQRNLPPSRITIGEERPSQAFTHANVSIVRGRPVSGGIIEGEIVVVDDPKQVDDISGKILVTKTTDPGWVYLLVSAVGIIAEKGSLLSHTAIIARELAKPAIVGVTDATRLFHDGQRVRLDAETGVIEVLHD